jgi:hypothetical protein
VKLSKKTPHYHDPMFMQPDLSDFQIAAHTRRVRLYFAADSLSLLALGPHQFVIRLETQPKAGRGPEVAA